MSEDTMDQVPELDEDAWYEICPDCGGELDAFCLHCFDVGLLPHDCSEAE